MAGGTFSLFYLAEWYSIVSIAIYLASSVDKWISRIFFAHSAVDGHSGCSCILTTANNAAVNIGKHVSFQITWFFFFPNKYLGIELLAHMVVLFLVF